MPRTFVRVTRNRVIHAPASDSSSTNTEAENSHPTHGSSVGGKRPAFDRDDETRDNSISKRLETGIINLGVFRDTQHVPAPSVVVRAPRSGQPRPSASEDTSDLSGSVIVDRSASSTHRRCNSEDYGEYGAPEIRGIRTTGEVGGTPSSGAAVRRDARVGHDDEDDDDDHPPVGGMDDDHQRRDVGNTYRARGRSSGESESSAGRALAALAGGAAAGYYYGAHHVTTEGGALLTADCGTTGRVSTLEDEKKVLEAVGELFRYWKFFLSEEDISWTSEVAQFVYDKVGLGRADDVIKKRWWGERSHLIRKKIDHRRSSIASAIKKEFMCKSPFDQCKFYSACPHRSCLFILSHEI
jgi:hypothetical protein